MSRGKPITQAEARLNLHALDILSGKTTVPLKPRQRKVQHEAQIQKNLFEWARLSSGKYPELKLMFHIPNGGRRDKIEAYHLKLQGIKSGVPDIYLPAARNGKHGLFLELKSESGRLQESQKEWITELNRQGYEAVTAYGFDEAKAAILKYLGEYNEFI
ncbi:MAG: VRR-NUC domain-containing protein [Eubacterium sp.]|jgi:hypothetical protein|nr:VRR-NUC domain-containing protein [Eubacterium sp.]